MIKWMISKTIKDHQNIKNKKVREQYGVLAGIVGIINNFILFAMKIVIGFLVGSIAVISDAYNNLSDMGSSMVAIAGSKLSNQAPDEEHPYGHGRLEYVAALIVSFIILTVGIELIRNSIDKIINPTAIEPTLALYVILGFSILIKLWMYSYNRYIAKLIGSIINQATALDSINDVFITSAVFGSIFIGQLIRFPIDGIIGIVIALMIMYTGFKVAKDTVSVLLGNAPDPKLVKKIEAIVKNNPVVLNTHDLIVHDYGPGKSLASIHVEVLENMKLVEAHRIVDLMEQKVLKDLGVDIVIHIDPVKIEEHPKE